MFDGEEEEEEEDEEKEDEMKRVQIRIERQIIFDTFTVHSLSRLTFTIQNYLNHFPS